MTISNQRIGNCYLIGTKQLQLLRNKKILVKVAFASFYKKSPAWGMDYGCFMALIFECRKETHLHRHVRHLRRFLKGSPLKWEPIITNKKNSTSHVTILCCWHTKKKSKKLKHKTRWSWTQQPSLKLQTWKSSSSLIFWSYRVAAGSRKSLKTEGHFPSLILHYKICNNLIIIKLSGRLEIIFSRKRKFSLSLFHITKFIII